MKPNVDRKDRARGHQDLSQAEVRARKRAEKAKVRKILADYENR